MRGGIRGMKTAANRWRTTIGDALRTELWPVPAVAVVAAVALGVVMPRVDAHVDDALPPIVTAYLFNGGPEAARSVLSAVASSLVTATSLTFSLTVVTLQLASSQFSPRLLRTFTRDRLVHLSLGVLLATFVYALTVLRTVRASLSDQAAFVPQLAVTIAFALTVLSVVTLVAFLAHLARQIRVESMLREVHAETLTTMRRLLTGSDGRDSAVGQRVEVPTDAALLCAPSSGFLAAVDSAALLSAAICADVVIHFDRLPGDSLIAGTPIAAVWRKQTDGALAEDIRAVVQDRVADAVNTKFERTPVQDVAFGLRQLVDVTSKALSPGINDPTTAVHALGHISALLCEAAQKDFSDELLRDKEGQVRVVLRRPEFDQLLDLGVTQPRRFGAGDPEVLSRIAALLREVAWVSTRPADHLAITRQVQRLSDTVDRQDFDDTERGLLHDQLRAVRNALIGRWPVSAP